MEVRTIFAKKFNEIMKYSHISYAELARKLNITKATMSMYKHGKALPSLETFSAICDL
ncbi:MAG: helix-turn-helix transcriptional regulator, partial [Clostridia bacterium]|nr:helix-turn-helix transcriptional regulator [Clostridia bacterium]